MNFDFNTANRILFGEGALKEIGTIARQFGNKAVIVAGGDPKSIENLKEILSNSEIEFVIFKAAGEPTTRLVEEAIRLAKENGSQFVIGLGGGSAIDIAKAISVMLTNPGELLDYLEVVGKNRAIDLPAAPMIAVPTTSGTGSEVTRNAVLAVPEKKVKVSMRSAYILPRVALVDPELTYGLPPRLTANTGMDALTQVLEPYVSLKANSMVDMFCREGMKRAARSLEKAYHDGSDRQARIDMSWTSLLGGLSLANAGLGAVHGFAGPIGGMFHAPHGAICASLLAPVTAMNVKALALRAPGEPALERYHEIAKILTGKDSASIKDGIDWLQSLKDALEIPGLSEYGIAEENFSEIIDKALVASSMRGNPIQLQREELEVILREAL
ncbi:MAG TPA: iron-containing alcohol dehydrogenase [Longilinea sp.]|nr:iron-containing alcohol dehydrogenase [Longilinea sp.]